MGNHGVVRIQSTDGKLFFQVSGDLSFGDWIAALEIIKNRFIQEGHQRGLSRSSGIPDLDIKRI